MSSFAVRYRSRGKVREVRWTNGELLAEPLVETVISSLVRSRHVVRRHAADGGEPASLDTAEPAALTILEALHDVGAQILHWDGNPLGR